MPKTKKTKTGYTTDAGEDLFAHGAPVPRTSPPRSRTSCGRPSRPCARRNQRLTGASTPQSPPRAASPHWTRTCRTFRPAAEGLRIREGFVVGDGYESLLTADYSQIEMRIMAHLSGDEGLIEAFREGRILVRGLARVRRSRREVTGEMRSKVKAMSYGIAYGLSAYGLSQQARISRSEAEELMADDYYKRFGG